MEGKYDKAKGEVKQDVGDAMDDTKLQAEGTWDKMKGGVKEAVGNMQEDMSDDKDKTS